MSDTDFDYVHIDLSDRPPKNREQVRELVASILSNYARVSRLAIQPTEESVFFAEECERAARLVRGEPGASHRQVQVDHLAADRCHADRDGDCNWSGCPQAKAGEPAATGRHCPLDREPEEC